MSEIRNSGLDQYGKVYSLSGIGDERAKLLHRAKPAAEKCYFYIMTAKPTLLPSTINSYKQMRGELYSVPMNLTHDWLLKGTSTLKNIPRKMNIYVK